MKGYHANVGGSPHNVEIIIWFIASWFYELKFLIRLKGIKNLSSIDTRWNDKLMTVWMVNENHGK